MYLLPAPKELTFYNGNFNLNRETEIMLDAACNFKNYEAAKLLKQEIRNETNLDLLINKAAKHGNNVIFLRTETEIDPETETGDIGGYTIIIKENAVLITGYGDEGLFYGIQTLRQIIRQQGVILLSLRIQDAPHFESRGFFHDVTRGKVPTLATLKELVDRMAFYKMNQLHLYIEHTFAFKGFSEVWTGKDPLSAEEILELDQYCRQQHVELVPSVATFGHLYEVLMTKSFNSLCEISNTLGEPFSWYRRMAHHTLDVSQPESFAFVSDMLREFIPLFSSEKFNINCDETFDIGKDRSTQLVESRGVERVYVDFLKKIIETVKSYGKQVMFWGDIILKCPEYLAELPKDVICLNWAYHSNVTEEGVKTLAEAGMLQYVCPGVGGWNRMMNALDSSFVNISKMIQFGKKYGAVGVLNTDWGDYGHVNLFGNSMPGMIYGAALSWNPGDDRETLPMDEAISVLEYGRDAKNLVSKLRELSRFETASWFHMVCFVEYRITKDEKIGGGFRDLKNFDAAALAEGYHGAVRLEAEIIKEGSLARTNRGLDVQEFVVSARGAALMNAACLCIQKYELGQEALQEVLTHDRLAVELEYWLEDLNKLWHRRNKASEFYRIRDKIQQLCSYFRSLPV